jgi:hypothetical protein
LTEICRACARQHLLSVDYSGCPQCRAKWSAEFVSQHCGSTWHSQVFRRHLRQTSVKHAQACLAQDSNSIRAYAEAVQQLKELQQNKRLAELTAQAELAQRALRDAQLENRHAVSNAQARMYAALDIQQQTKTKTEFVHCCAQPGCDGFLSTRGKCLVCSKWTCLACNTAKTPANQSDPVDPADLPGHVADQTNQTNHDGGGAGTADGGGGGGGADVVAGQPDWSGHVCREEDLASVKLIRAKTTRCPACGVPCERSRGCDDMWCIMCHASFSYRTGQIRDRAVHNPEREKWLESGQQAATRKRKADVLAKPGQNQPGQVNQSNQTGHDDNACVELIPKLRLTAQLRWLPQRSIAIISDVYDFAAHLRDNVLVEHQRQISSCCNPLALRVKFATKEIDVGTLGSELERQQRRKDHLESCQSVFQVLFECLRDVINNAASQPWMDSHIASLKFHDQFVANVNRLLVFAQQRTHEISRVSSLTLRLPQGMTNLLGRTTSLVNEFTNQTNHTNQTKKAKQTKSTSSTSSTSLATVHHPVVQYVDMQADAESQLFGYNWTSSASSAGSASFASSTSSARSAGLDRLVRSVSAASQARSNNTSNMSNMSNMSNTSNTSGFVR